MALINEPAPGSGGVNVRFVDGAHPLEQLVVACRPIAQGEELFVDYGMNYDRSGYSQQKSDA